MAFSMSGFFDGLSTVFKPVSQFISDNPVVSAMLINGIAGIFEPSAYDTKKQELQAQEEFNAIDRKRRNENLSVGGLGLPEPTSRASQFLNNPILQHRRKKVSMMEPEGQTGILQR